jgi:hypothetical protein
MAKLTQTHLKGNGMLNRNVWLTTAGVALGFLLCGRAALGQTPATAATAPTDPNVLRRMAVDPNQWRAAYAQSMMQALGATEEEWKVLDPLIHKIDALRGHLANATRMAGMGRALTPINGDFAVSPDSVNEVAKKWQEMLTVLDNKDSGPDRIKLALKEYREARAIVQAEIDKTQAQLKQLLTVRQEIYLKQRGTLQ